LVAAVVAFLAACGSTSSSAAKRTTTTASEVASTAVSTTPQASTTLPTRRGQIARPEHFPEPTFIQSGLGGQISVVRISDGKELQLLRAPTRLEVTGAMRAPNGDLLIAACTPPACGRTPPQYVFAPFWHDQASGMTFPGGLAAVSADGSRIATVIGDTSRHEIVRQYDFSTGRTLSDLDVGKVGNSYNVVTALDWMPDGRALLVAASGSPGGLYVVDRDARELPSHPTVPDPSIDGQPGYFPAAAMLADGHAIAFESTGIQHTAWPGALVDVDLATGTVRVLLGSTRVFGDERPRCGTEAAEHVAADACELTVDSGSIAAHGDEALFNNFQAGQIWIYDGHTSRLIGTPGYGIAPTW
jgi:hypothetical protein